MSVANFAQLRWQCRRGTLELDRLLLGYLDKVYRQAPPEEQALFQAFLRSEDSDLLAWLIQDEQPEQSSLRVLIEKIRVTTPSD